MCDDYFILVKVVYSNYFILVRILGLRDIVLIPKKEISLCS